MAITIKCRVPFLDDPIEITSESNTDLHSILDEIKKFASPKTATYQRIKPSELTKQQLSFLEAIANRKDGINSIELSELFSINPHRLAVFMASLSKAVKRKGAVLKKLVIFERMSRNDKLIRIYRPMDDLNQFLSKIKKKEIGTEKD